MESYIGQMTEVWKEAIMETILPADSNIISIHKDLLLLALLKVASI